MLQKTPGRAAAAATLEYIAFEYTEEEWAEIVRSLQHLQPSEKDLGKARRQLRDAARRYRREKANAPGKKIREKISRRDWARIVKLSEEAIHLLRKYSDIESAPDPDGGPPADPWRAHKEALTKLWRVARSRLAESRIDDGFPRAAPRAWYQFYVLETWTRLGGKLQFSRHPQKHKITGPLARYFAAVTQPVLGGSLESLPDIVKRHKAVRLAFSKWYVSALVANLEIPGSFTEAMSDAEALGMGDWANQEYVQALLEEAFHGVGPEEMSDEP
jgi:hypothetical protein